MTKLYLRPKGETTRAARTLKSAGLDLLTLGLAITLLLFGGSLADAQTVPFTPVHIYYISPTGNDANAGTSPSSPWMSPHHNVVCGDVIIAAAGNYAKEYSVFGTNSWGTVANCPSTSGGIDGKGGIYFAIVLCAGPYVTSCAVNGGAQQAFRVDQSNWAVEGFTTTQNSNGAGGCNMATSETATTQHHIAFINDIAANCNLAGFGTVSWTNPGGVDQTAVVGAIVYNSSPSYAGNCGSGVSIIPVDGPDTSAGTHVFVAGYFGYKNINAPSGAGCNTDGEGLIFDSWACGKFTHQGVAEQNVWWYNGGPGFEVFPNCLANGDRAQVYVFYNTSYGNAQDPLHTGSSSDLLLGNIAPVPAYGSFYGVFENVVVSTEATSGNAGEAPVYTAAIWLTNSGTSLVRLMGNVFWQSNPGTDTTAGNPNTDVWASGLHNATSFPFGTNAYGDPHFANPNGLPTEAPNCSNYTNTTACMNDGYQVAANLIPDEYQVVGYREPGACATDPYFPVWLKGVVFLLWNGGTLTESQGLITKPCDM
jgi:hypothetical protein